MSEILAEGTALVVRAQGDVTLEHRSFGPPGPSEVLISPAFVGLCGTDLDIVNGALDPEYVHYPVVLGHEWSGHVIAAGPGVGGFTAGDPVVVEGIVACFQCIPCRAGKTNMCSRYDEIGFTRDGAAGPAVMAPAASVHKLSANAPIRSAALIEPAAVVLRGLREIGPVPGSRVLIIGDGTVALLAAQLVRLWSPTSVTVAGQRESQVTLAAAMGVDSFSTTPPKSHCYDIVVEAAGSQAAVETALRSADRGGKVLLLGIVGHGRAAKLHVDDFVNHDLTLRGSFSYTAAAWAETVDLFNNGRLKTDPLVTHVFPLEEFALAITTLQSGGGDARGKILFDLRAQ